MNFFQAQDSARRHTVRLALLFAAAVLSLILLTNLLVATVFVWTGNYVSGQQPQSLRELLSSLPAETWILITLAVVGVVGLASLYKFLLIRGGGKAVAESLNGHLLTYEATQGRTRRLLNVVEEMAIAAGVPVPPVYLIPEPSINAFAAGFGPDDAVIGINQGTLDVLSRDELQGVIAHEFSHILNGDMRINLRLIAILHGILFIGIVGYMVLRSMGHGGRSSRGNNPVPLLALGAGLLVIGYAGTFFGNLIKAAVSRQREYLADAAAVQFTRNPDGIAGALKKIGGYSEGSSIGQAAAAEASHLFFGQVRRLFLNNLTATHPPLEKRIRAIDPGWDGTFPVVAGTAAPTTTAPAGASAFGGAASEPAASAHREAIPVVRVDAATMPEKVGTLDANGMAAAQALIAGTDSRLKDAAHDPWGARGLVYAILLDQDPEMRDRQFAFLQEQAERGVPEHTQRLARLIAEVDPPRRLALLGMAMPALKTLSRSQYERFSANVVALIKMDRRISLVEWVLHRLLVKELKPHFENPRPPRSRHRRVDQVAREAGTLLSTLARFGHDDAATRAAAFAAGVAALELRDAPEPQLEEDDDANFARLNQAMHQLVRLRPLAKPKLIKACVATATFDDRVSPLEGALLQGFAAALDCPLPPSIYTAS